MFRNTTKIMPKLIKNGWYTANRKDSNTGRIRPMKILYRNGHEVEHHWIDIPKVMPDVSIFDLKTPDNFERTSKMLEKDIKSGKINDEFIIVMSGKTYTRDGFKDSSYTMRPSEIKEFHTHYFDTKHGTLRQGYIDKLEIKRVGKDESTKLQDKFAKEGYNDDTLNFD